MFYGHYATTQWFASFAMSGNNDVVKIARTNFYTYIPCIITFLSEVVCHAVRNFSNEEAT